MEWYEDRLFELFQIECNRCHSKDIEMHLVDDYAIELKCNGCGNCYESYE